MMRGARRCAAIIEDLVRPATTFLLGLPDADNRKIGESI